MNIALRHLLAAGACLWSLGVAAQPANDAAEVRQMIDALRPSGPTRNFVVRPVEKPASEAAPAPAKPPATAPAAPAAPTANEPGLSLALPFKPGSAQLAPDAGPVLGTLLAALLSPELRDMHFVIEGHTDAVGPAAQNLRLSQQRADEVKQYLTAFGIAPARLRTVGKGATEPLNPANPRAAENRRVRIVAAP